MSNYIKTAIYFIGFIFSYWLSLVLSNSIFSYLYQVNICYVTETPGWDSGVPVAVIRHDSCAGYWIPTFLVFLVLFIYLIHRFVKARKND